MDMRIHSEYYFKDICQVDTRLTLTGYVDMPIRSN